MYIIGRGTLNFLNRRMLTMTIAVGTARSQSSVSKHELSFETNVWEAKRGQPNVGLTFEFTRKDESLSGLWLVFSRKEDPTQTPIGRIRLWGNSCILEEIRLPYQTDCLAKLVRSTEQLKEMRRQREFEKTLVQLVS